jgi:hypothetical protein
MTLHPPRPVRMASVLLLGAGGVGAVAAADAGLSLARLHSAQATLFAVAGSGDDVVDTVATIESELRFQLIVAIGAMLVLTVLALAVRRPSQPARLAAWVSAFVVAIGWSCAVASSTELHTQRGASEPMDIQNAFRALLPPWYSTLTSLVAAAFLALLAAAAVALLRTASSEYYRSAAYRGAPGLYTYVRRPEPPATPES